jgi:tRNA dimethylallyltransferase
MSNWYTPHGRESGAALPPLALIAGPTASGKSDLAVRLALALQAQGRKAVVINADSSQVYADLRVLSARPTTEDMRGVRHELFGHRDGGLVYSAAEWSAAAKRIILPAIEDGTIPILVGGSGLYIRSLLDGIAPIPRVEPAIREAVRALSLDEAYQQLTGRDPTTARRLHPNDTTRIYRALEVERSTGMSINYWQSMRRDRLLDRVTLHPAILLPDRETIYQRCDARFAQMLSDGAIEEVRLLLARNLDPALPVARAIGVREIAGYLAGEWTLAEAEVRAAQATRNYAKRQYTWFRNQPPADWPRVAAEPFSENEIFERLLRY